MFPRWFDSHDVLMMGQRSTAGFGWPPTRGIRSRCTSSATSETGQDYSGTEVYSGNDPASGRKWYRKAAELGYVPAMHALGKALVGLGESEDAENWFRRAADTGTPDGLGALGQLVQTIRTRCSSRVVFMLDLAILPKPRFVFERRLTRASRMRCESWLRCLPVEGKPPNHRRGVNAPRTQAHQQRPDYVPVLRSS